jgi:hypothetical protein
VRLPVLLLAVLLLATPARAQDAAKEMLVVPPAADRPLEKGGEVSSPAPASESEAEAGAAAAEPAPEDAPADEITPQAFPLSRYAGLWENSPFQLESIAPPAVSEGLSQRYALTGIAQIDGDPIAFLMERATQQRLMLKKDAEQGGLSLVQVDVQQKYDDSTVTVRQGGEVGVVKFDATAATVAAPAPIPGMSAAQVQQMPGMRSVAPPQQAVGVTVPGNPQDPFGQGAVPQPPGVVPGVPGPGVSQNNQVQQPPNPQQPGPPRVIRRRAIVPATP